MTAREEKFSRSLSQFFRMAVVNGVETAVQLHISRGDDLNARDTKGKTPLMLAAERNAATVCELLLAAGADITLLDPLGRDASQIARSAGAVAAAAALEAYCTSAQATRDGRASLVRALAEEPASIFQRTQAPPPCPFSTVFPTEGEGISQTALAQPPHKVAQFADDEGELPDLGAWEPEEDHPPPRPDSVITAAAGGLQAAITGHIPIDTSADWEDFEAFLPYRATPLPRSDDPEARARLRLLLLRAIREGSVPEIAVHDLTRINEDKPDLEVSALLCMVINDLGSETDERFEYSASHESFEVAVAAAETPAEEEAVNEALTFMDELASRNNEPIRLYMRDFQSMALLTAEAEVTLSQAMERDIEKALNALAAWPGGVIATLRAAQEVVNGAKPLRWLSSGPRAAPLGDEINSGVGLDPETGIEVETPEDSEAEDAGHPIGGSQATADELAEFCSNFGLLSGLTITTDRSSSEWETCRSALTSLRLTRAFLMDLADSKSIGEPRPAQAFRQAIRGFRRSRDEMTVANLKLVNSIAKKYLFSGQPLDDLLQEGNIGLLRAVDRYDWRRGFRFSTYATWWIRQQVSRFVADKGSTIRLPVHVYEKTQRINQTIRNFELRYGHAPSFEEVAGLVGLPVHKVIALSLLGQETLPISDLPDIDERIPLVANGLFGVRDPMEVVENIQLIDVVDRFLGGLKRKESAILRMRFGIGTRDEMTLDEIGMRLDVTRERIRQVEAKAIRHLQHPGRVDKLLWELNGKTSPDKSRRGAGANSERVDQGAGDTTTVEEAYPEATPKLKSQIKKRLERTDSSKKSMIETLLDHVKAMGFAVDESSDGPERRIWVRIMETPDKQSRKIVRKLNNLGFSFLPGKGYWR